MHGPAAARRRKMSDYGLRLREKQKARIYYGMGEHQFQKFFVKASKQKGMAGDNFIKLLESRLDNFLYRLGLAASRQQARQLIRHNHFLVNNHRVNIPSFILRDNDTVQIKETSVPLFKQALDLMAKKKMPAWYNYDVSKKEGQFYHYPRREEIDTPADEQMIVEFYSR